MTQDVVTQIIYNAVMLTLMLSLPAVGLGLAVGLVISLFQAVTQIQEQTLTFVPKMIVVMLVIALTSPWLISLTVDFTLSLWSTIPNMVK